MIYLLLVVMALVGGVSVPINKVAVHAFSPTFAVLIRAIISFLFILPFTYKIINFKEILKDKKLLFSNLLFAGNWLFFAVGVNLTSVLMAIMIYVPTSLVVAILNYLIFKEKLNRYQAIGLIFVILGMSLVVAGSITNPTDISFGNPIGNILIAAGALTWSLYLVFSAKYSNHYKPEVTTALNFLMVIPITLLILPLTFSKDQFAGIDLTAGNVSALIYTAIFSSVVFFYLYQVLIKKASAFVSSLALYPPNILGIIISVFLFKEKFSLSLIIGAILVFVGIFMATTYIHVKKYVTR